MVIPSTSFIDALSKSRQDNYKLDANQLTVLLNNTLNNNQAIENVIQQWSELVATLNTNIIILTDADINNFSKQTDKLSIIPEDSFKLPTASSTSSSTPRANRVAQNKENIVLYYDSYTQKFYLLEYRGISIFEFNKTPRFIVLLLFLYYHEIFQNSRVAFLYQNISDEYNNNTNKSDFNRYAKDILDISSQTVQTQQPVDVLDIAVNIDLYPGDAIPLAKRPVLACNNKWDTIVSSWRKIWGQDPIRTTIPNSYRHSQNVSRSIPRPYYRSSSYGPSSYGSSSYGPPSYRSPSSSSYGPPSSSSYGPPSYRSPSSSSYGSPSYRSRSNRYDTTSSLFSSGGTRKKRAHKKSRRAKRTINRTKNLRQT
jgi:hypothetical protein